MTVKTLILCLQREVHIRSDRCASRFTAVLGGFDLQTQRHTETERDTQRHNICQRHTKRTHGDFIFHPVSSRRRMQRWRGRVDDSGKCNRAVLVSVAQFVPGVSLGRRPGADKDTKTLHRTLSKLGFKVDIHSDLSGDEIYQLFLKESRRPVKDCFLAVLSSHGDEGCVFGADGKPVQLCRLFSYFDNENMEKKAKVFLVQVRVFTVAHTLACTQVCGTIFVGTHH
ncbi:caspase-3-like [Perca fluviatilis]|uniref:caspase-3-like n=1 Tax=Perca fluviatilis TaxID=8168 RepID=UPI001963E3FF|nr:caspase-3-like [Perca fluviatilis]